MEYEIFIWKTRHSTLPEIQTPVEASDPITAALFVMDRFGLRRACHVFVLNDTLTCTVAEFVDVDLDAAGSSPDVLVSYDYGM